MVQLEVTDFSFLHDQVKSTVMLFTEPSLCSVGLHVTPTPPKSPAQAYGVVPKELLTFLGSLYKESVITTSGTLVYHFERQTARKKNISSFQKHSVLNLECRILSQEHDTISKQNKKI